MALIENSAKAAARNGEFLLDASPGRSNRGFGATQQALLKAAELLRKKGYKVHLDEETAFIGKTGGLMGYASWGSNDGKFSKEAYRSLGFAPGAIAETYVSTSARTFKPTEKGQSLIADLIHNGITGIKGYVSEPFTFALARVDILFDRYTDGYNLAESFFMATPLLKWKGLVIGDPLCAPYRKDEPPQRR